MIVVGIACIVALVCVAIALISAILPSKEKWEELKKQTENRRKKK